MPQYVNPNNYPVSIAISHPLSCSLLVAPHSWPASRLAYNAIQVIELPESVARNFTGLGMLAPAPDNGEILKTETLPTDDRKVAITSLLNNNPDFSKNNDENEDARPVTTSNKIAAGIPKGKGTYVVAETNDKRMLFIAGPVTEEAGREKLEQLWANHDEHTVRLSLVIADNEEEAGRARRYGHFLEKVVKEYGTVETIKPTPAPHVEQVEQDEEIPEDVDDEEPAEEPVKPEKRKTGRPPKNKAPEPTPAPKFVPKFVPPATDKPKAVFSFKPKTV